MPNIYLIGMMGSGKSVTGKKLASLLGASFVDLDDLIQERTGRTINDIFEKDGEGFFRSEEAVILKEVSGVSPRVVATGGGTVLRPENVARMRGTGKIVYLETSLAVLWERVRNKKDRPLLRQGDPQENLRRILAEREPFYKQVCDFRVDTNGQTAEAVAQKIFSLLEKE